MREAGDMAGMMKAMENIGKMWKCVWCEHCDNLAGFSTCVQHCVAQWQGSAACSFTVQGEATVEGDKLTLVTPILGLYAARRPRQLRHNHKL